ncbi:hypothetical protein ACJX0J_003667, partial (mitochondrion) [Zea mays]
TKCDNLQFNFGQMTVSGCKEDKRWIGLASLSTQSMGMQVQYLVRWLIIKQDRETVLQFMLNENKYLGGEDSLTREGVAAIYNRKFIDWQAQVSKQDTGISIWFRAIVNARNMHEYLAKQKAKGRHVWYNLEGYCWLAFKRQKKVVSSIFLGALLTHSMWAGDNREWKNNELSKKMDAAPFFQGIRIIRKIFTFLLNNRATSGAVNGFTEYKEELMDAVPGIKEKELGGIFHLETSISVGSNLLDADYPSLDQIQFNKEQENFILKSVNLGFLHPLVL